MVTFTQCMSANYLVSGIDWVKIILYIVPIKIIPLTDIYLGKCIDSLMSVVVYTLISNGLVQ